jgi:hypothetical protein
METASRFDRLMDELVRLRKTSEQKWEINERRWEENQRQWKESKEEDERKWAENQRQWKEFKEEDNRKWADNQRRWDENQRQWDENQRRWDENQRQWEENQRRWDENQQQLRAIQLSIKDLDKKFERKFDQTIGALGTRWGLHSEAAFRNALAGILREFPGVVVLHANDYDEEGVVFGHPEQVELDLIMKNGMLIVAEIKSSVGKAEVYIFERKVRFYERKHGRQATRILIISPMIEDNARIVAEKLRMEVYSYADQVLL